MSNEKKMGMDQGDIFSLFSESVPEELLVKVEEEKKKKEKEEQKKQEIAKRKNTTVEKSEPDEMKKQISLPVTVYYAREKFVLTEQTFDETTLKEGKVSKDDVRQFLERSFPELSKERTIMEYDAEKHEIIPIVKAANKGKM